MKKYVALVVILLLFLVNCASTPIRWVSTPEYSNLDYDKAWQVIVSTITEDFEIDVIEKDSGYLMTAWKSVSATMGEQLEGYEKAGIRVTCKVEKRDPFRLKLKVQRGVLDAGSWQPKSGDEKWELELLEEIKLRLK